MENIISELPLVIFTTCVLLGAGGYAALGIAEAVRRPSPAEGSQEKDDAGKKVDFRPLIFLVIILAGFVAAFFHLASPLHAPFALTGIGKSPMSNEIAIGIVFAVAAALYCIFTMTRRLKGTAARICMAILAILGVIFAGFTGAAYMMGTIVAWDTPLSIVAPIGLSLMAGPILLISLRPLLGGDALSKTEHSVLLATAAVGIIIGFGALGIHVFQVGGLHSGMIQGSSLVHGIIAPLVVSVVLGVVSLVLCWRTLFGNVMLNAYSVVTLVLIVASVFAARLVFYGLQLSVGL